MPQFINVKREGHSWNITRDLTVEEKKEWFNARRKTTTERLTVVEAKVISPRLAILKYEKAREYTPARYHVIHIPTGLVIADIEYDMVGMVKKTFEKGKWVLQNENTLCLWNDKIEFEMTCKIRYEIIKDVE